MICRRDWNGMAAALRRSPQLIVCLAVLFLLLFDTKVAVLALVFKNSQKSPPVVSDTIIHVGNLDWQLPIDDVTAQITQIVSSNLSKDASFNIKLVKLPILKRKRDAGKFHQGSATVVFENAYEANLGMEAMLQLVETVSTTDANHWKVRWAVVETSPKVKEKPKKISQERLEHRKKRAEKYARKRRKKAAATDVVIASLLAKLDETEKDSLIIGQTPILKAPLLDWKACPEEIDPMKGGKIRKGTQRGERKRAAVEAFLEVVNYYLLADEANNSSAELRLVADLGCGAGNLTVPLAWWLKQLGVSVLGVDINKQALSLLSKRSESLGIHIHTLHADLLTLSNEQGVWMDCTAVVSLHACGAASDLSMAAAVEKNLPFAISPCCIGKLSTERTFWGRMPSSAQRSAAPLAVTYPRSTWLQKMVSQDDYKLLASAADYGVGSTVENNPQEVARRERCKLSKKIIELDRLQWAKQNGYTVRMLEMPRIGPLYPKRELLLGAKEGSRAAMLLSRLPTE